MFVLHIHSPRREREWRMSQHTATMADVLAKFWDLVIDGDVDGLAALFAGSPTVDDPCAGSIRGLDDLKVFVNDIRCKLKNRKARIECIATLQTPTRVVCEWIMHVHLQRGQWPFPVAAVAELNDVKKFTSVRIYNSTWPQTGTHGIRLPVLPEDTGIVLEGAVADYQKSLAAGNVEGIVVAFEASGTAREPSGGPYEYTGTEKLREAYSRMFSSGGGIPLRYCTATDDGKSCAIEYICDKWGNSILPPQAGVAVYERGASGRLAAARIYDDVEPPAISNTSERS